MFRILKPRSGSGTRFLFIPPQKRSVSLPVLSLIYLLIAMLYSSDHGLIAGGIHKNAERDSLYTQIDSLKQRIQQLQQNFQKFTPQKPYLLVNSTANELRLMSGQTVLRKAVCSTGSYILLRAYGERKWLFKTPRGRFKVNVKLKEPWWYKPDWAYIEEGLPVPSPYSPKRYEPNVLGDYALGFGNGYLIHGTIYKRFLGMPITHGCVRLGDQDMQVVFETMSHGYRIYVY